MQSRVVMITGATSGIGRATALLFAKKGIAVAALGRCKTKGEALTAEITAAGGAILFISLDVTDADALCSAVQDTVQHFGRLDYAVNNAGTEGALGSSLEMAEEDFYHVIDTNLKGVWLSMKYQIPAILRSGGGAVVNIATNLTKIALPGTGLYTASKSAVEGLTRVAAMEYGKQGIRMNTVCPGAVDTPMLRRIHSQSSLDALAESNPLGKLAQPEDLAETIVWLCSPAAGHIHGESIVVDGGASIATI